MKRFFCSLLGQVEVELEDHHALPREVVFEPRDVGQPLVPDALVDELRRHLLRLPSRTSNLGLFASAAGLCFIPQGRRRARR